MMGVVRDNCTHQERGDDTEQRRSSIDRANKEYAQLKLKRDDLTNQRK